MVGGGCMCLSFLVCELEETMMRLVFSVCLVIWTMIMSWFFLLWTKELVVTVRISSNFSNIADMVFF